MNARAIPVWQRFLGNFASALADGKNSIEQVGARLDPRVKVGKVASKVEDTAGSAVQISQKRGIAAAVVIDCDFGFCPFYCDLKSSAHQADCGAAVESEEVNSRLFLWTVLRFLGDQKRRIDSQRAVELVMQTQAGMHAA